MLANVFAVTGAVSFQACLLLAGVGHALWVFCTQHLWVAVECKAVAYLHHKTKLVPCLHALAMALYIVSTWADGELSVYEHSLLQPLHLHSPTLPHQHPPDSC